MNRKLAVYRPNKSIEKGYAFQFSGSVRKNGDRVMFVEAVRQTKEKPEDLSAESSPFEWKGKLTVMLNSGELANLAVSILDGHEVVFQHKTPKGSSTTKFTPPGERSRDWYVSVNTSRSEEDGSVTRNSVAGFISHGDVYTLKLMSDRLILDDVLLGETSENAKRATAV